MVSAADQDIGESWRSRMVLSQDSASSFVSNEASTNGGAWVSTCSRKSPKASCCPVEAMKRSASRMTWMGTCSPAASGSSRSFAKKLSVWLRSPRSPVEPSSPIAWASRSPAAFSKILEGVPLASGGDEVQCVPCEAENSRLLWRLPLAPTPPNHLLCIRKDEGIRHGFTARARGPGATSDDVKAMTGASNRNPPPLPRQ